MLAPGLSTVCTCGATQVGHTCVSPNGLLAWSRPNACRADRDLFSFLVPPSPVPTARGIQHSTGGSSLTDWQRQTGPGNGATGSRSLASPPLITPSARFTKPRRAPCLGRFHIVCAPGPHGRADSFPQNIFWAHGGHTALVGAWWRGRWLLRARKGVGPSPRISGWLAPGQRMVNLGQHGPADQAQGSAGGQGRRQPALCQEWVYGTQL